MIHCQKQKHLSQKYVEQERMTKRNSRRGSGKRGEKHAICMPPGQINQGFSLRKEGFSRAWQHNPLILALGKKRLVEDTKMFKTSLLYIASFRSMMIHNETLSQKSLILQKMQAQFAILVTIAESSVSSICNLITHRERVMIQTHFPS